MAAVDAHLKEALVETLLATLSPDPGIRKAGESRIQALEVTEDFGTYLTELTLDSSASLPLRQLSSVLLHQYVETHWSQHSDKFRAPEASESAKAVIRQLLPAGLHEPISKVRSAVAYAISAIAHWDWPEQWPSLFDTLMACLKTSDQASVHGAMRVLTEFSRDLTDTQIPQVAPIILPEVYNVFLQNEKYSIRTRGRAVQIFTTLATMVCTMGEYQKGLVKSLLSPMLLPFTEALVRALHARSSATTDSGLRADVLKALTVLVKNVPKQLSGWLVEILPTVWETLTHSAEVYVRTVVQEQEEGDQVVDSDGELLNFENLVLSIFDFVHALVETHRFRKSVKQGMVDIIYYIILYLQITEQQAQEWSSNPDRFVEDESEDSFSYSVRISAQDLLLSLCQECEEEAGSGLGQAVARHLAAAEATAASAQAQAQNPGWWKTVEASLLALGVVRDLVLQRVRQDKLGFDLLACLQNGVTEHSTMGASPYLLGRCLWTGSRFAALLPEQTLHRYLQATIGALQPSQDVVVRLSAVRAVHGFAEHLKSTNQTQLLVPYLPVITDGLLSLALQYQNEVLSLAMETLAIILRVDKDFTVSYEPKVAPLTIALFLKHNTDPVITDLAQEIFKALSSSEQCLGPLQQRLIPTLVSMLSTPSDKIATGVHVVAFDVLQTLIRSSKPPMSDLLLRVAFPAAAQCILSTEDIAVMQSGGECLRAYVSVAAEQLAAFADAEGRSGLAYVIQVSAQLLHPAASEFSASFVGRLVTSLIRKAGSQLGENLDLLLRAVLSKMQGVEALSVLQSLIMVYAHLVHSQMEAVLQFLSTVPGPTGQSALHFVLSLWCGRQHLFYGSYENKVSTLALAKLLEQGVMGGDSRLADLTVEGEEIVTDHYDGQIPMGMQTRGQRRGLTRHFTSISVLAKIVKLLIYELSTALEDTMAMTDSEEEEEEDDERQDLSTVLDNLEQFEDDVEDDDNDPDAQSDPLYHINLQQHLTEFLRNFCATPYFPVSFLPHLNKQEKHVLELIHIKL